MSLSSVHLMEGIVVAVVDRSVRDPDRKMTIVGVGVGHVPSYLAVGYLYGPV